MARAFGDIDIYVDASRLAGFPVPVIEAMSCGAIPIVTYYGAPDAVHSGYNGYIIPPENPEAIAETINHLISLPLDVREDISKEAIGTAQQYTWDLVANRFLQALERGYQKRGSDS